MKENSRSFPLLILIAFAMIRSIGCHQRQPTVEHAEPSQSSTISAYDGGGQWMNDSSPQSVDSDLQSQVSEPDAGRISPPDTDQASAPDADCPGPCQDCQLRESTSPDGSTQTFCVHWFQSSCPGPRGRYSTCIFGPFPCEPCCCSSSGLP